jgi:hypothetical protein
MVRGSVRMSVARRGERKSVFPLLSTLVWVREGEEWRLLHRHATRLADIE